MISDQEQLNELRNKSTLLPAEKAKLKALERKEKQSKKKQVTPGQAVQSNVFAVKATTKVSPLPIRFLAYERAGLKTLANDIKSESIEEVIEVLGREDEINDTKLVRAAVLLLKQRSNSEIIQAIKEVKLAMVR